MYKINIEGLKEYYRIDKFGNIYSLYKENIKKLKYDIDKDGYFRVSLQKVDGKRSSYRVNRLVALTFIPNPNQYPVVNHINCNKKDNRVENLEWTTISKNTKHAYDNDLIEHGRKKRVKSINLITGEVIYFETIKDASAYYGKHFTDISKICNGKIKPYKRGKIANINFEFCD